MNYNFARLKRVVNVLLVIVFIYGAFRILLPDVYRFNPQYLVETSVLKNKSFSVSPQQIESPKLKIKAYLLEEHSNPIVNVFFLFKNSGSAHETAQKAGLGKLLSDMLLKGAGPYSMTAFGEILEQNAIEISFDNNKDEFFGILKFITKDEKVAAKMLNLALTKPAFPLNYMLQSKKELETQYQHQQERASSYMGVEAAKHLFGHHPYSHNRYGRPETIKSITISDLRAFMRQNFARDNLVVGISGDITAENAGKLLDNIFNNLPLKNHGKELAESKIDLSSPDVFLNRSLPQKIGIFAGKGLPMSDKDFYPLKVALEIFSGDGLTSRIQKAAREKKGLTYGVYGDITNYDKADVIFGQFSTTSENFEILKNLIIAEWIKFGQHGVTEDELEQAKNYLIASEPLRYADTENLSAMLSYIQKKNLGLDFLQKRNSYIKNVEIDDVNRVAKQYFTKENLRFIAIGNFAKEEPKRK